VMRSERTRVAAYCLPAAKLAGVAVDMRILHAISNRQFNG
jgi:hypothetical protein